MFDRINDAVFDVTDATCRLLVENDVKRLKMEKIPVLYSFLVTPGRSC